jgi:hypothetical protein
MLLPSCIRSKALLMSSRPMVWVMKVSRGSRRAGPFDVAGQLGAAAHAAEGRAAPDAPGDQLEGAGGDLLAGAGDADDDGFAPALVAALERRAHHLDVADALEGVIDAAVGEVDDDLLDRPVVVEGLMQSVAPSCLAISNLPG